MLRVLDEADVGGPGTDAERYLRVAMLRYLLLYTHDWTEDVVERLLGEVRPPSVLGRHHGARDPQGDELTAPTSSTDAAPTARSAAS